MQLSFLMKPPLPLFSNGLPSFNCHLSPAWSAIQCSFSSARLSVALNSSVRSKLGNGRTTRFWEDCWCGIVPLMSQFPRLYRLSTQLQATVCAVFYPTNNCFNLSWSRDLCESLIAEVERHFILHGGMDIKLRKHNTSPRVHIPQNQAPIFFIVFCFQESIRFLISFGRVMHLQKMMS